MKRKAAALLTAMLVMAMGSLTVQAAPSAGSQDTTTNENVETTVKAAENVTDTTGIEAKSEDGKTLTVKEVTGDAKKVVDSAVAEATAIMKDLKGLASEIAKLDSEAGKLLDAAASDSKYKVTAEVKAVVDLSGEKGTYTLTVPGIGANDIVYLLHDTGNGWETIPAKNLGNGQIEATLGDFSNYGVVAVAVVDTTPVPTNPEPDKKPDQTPNPAPGPQNPGQAPAGSANQGSADGASPKTGAEFPAAALIAGICLAGVAVCRRKVKFS